MRCCRMTSRYVYWLGALRFFPRLTMCPAAPCTLYLGEMALALIGTSICHHQTPVVHYRAGIQGGWTAEEEIGVLLPLGVPLCVFISPMVFGVMLHSQIETTPGHGLLDLLLGFSSCDSKKQNFCQFYHLFSTYSPGLSISSPLQERL